MNTRFITNAGYIFLIFCLLSSLSCDRRGEPVKPADPCLAVKPVTASFLIKEKVGDSLVVSDTILQYNYIVFTASEDYDSYEWQIGYDNRTFRDKTVKLLFTEAEGELQVTLKAHRKPDLQCFPNDDGVDVLTKSFYIIPWKDAPIIGKYEGYFESAKNELATVEITYTPPDYVQDPYGTFNLLNINKGCGFKLCKGTEPKKHQFNNTRGAKAFEFVSTADNCDDCQRPIAWAFLKNNSREIEIIFSFEDQSQVAVNGSYPRINDKFIGKRK